VGLASGGPGRLPCLPGRAAPWRMGAGDSCSVESAPRECLARRGYEGGTAMAQPNLTYDKSLAKHSARLLH
jgi:hypothetical protein